jgi:hypothetical protein
MTKFVNALFSALAPYNQSKLLAGVSMILLNLGSRYLIEELSETQEDLMNNKIFRRIVLFALIFIATKDIKVSLVLTGSFIILVSGLFNENSKYCILKKETFRNNKKISKEEYLKAKRIVEKYEKQKKNK